MKTIKYKGLRYIQAKFTHAGAYKTVAKVLGPLGFKVSKFVEGRIRAHGKIPKVGGSFEVTLDLYATHPEGTAGKGLVLERV